MRDEKIIIIMLSIAMKMNGGMVERSTLAPRSTTHSPQRPPPTIIVTVADGVAGSLWRAAGGTIEYLSSSAPIFRSSAPYLSCAPYLNIFVSSTFNLLQLDTYSYILWYS